MESKILVYIWRDKNWWTKKKPTTEKLDIVSYLRFSTSPSMSSYGSSIASLLNSGFSLFQRKMEIKQSLFITKFIHNLSM